MLQRVADRSVLSFFALLFNFAVLFLKLSRGREFSKE